MMKYLAGVLTVIAVGVLLIAYGLLVRPEVAASTSRFGQAVPAAEVAMPGPVRSALVPGGYTTDPQLTAPSVAGYQPQYVSYGQGVVDPAPRAIRTSQFVVEQPVRTAPRRVQRVSGRDWVRTALIIGGSSAAGAGVGGLIGGKKGALIGAAIGGGASALVQTRR